MSDAVAIVLAAGKGTRMKSDLPKVLHEVCGQSMVEHVFDAVRGAGVTRIICVIGHKADLMREKLGHHSLMSSSFCRKSRTAPGTLSKWPLRRWKATTGPVLVLAGDTPLLRAESSERIARRIDRQRTPFQSSARRSPNNNQGLGRIVRGDTDGAFASIVEEKDAD